MWPANPTLDDPLGEHGMDLHEWVVGLDAWRKVHGREGGRARPGLGVGRGVDRRTGAVMMGRKMFSGGSGRWTDDPNARGWWADDPRFGVPVFVLTHRKRELLAMGGTDFYFVTDGPEAALERPERRPETATSSSPAAPRRSVNTSTWGDRGARG